MLLETCPDMLMGLLVLFFMRKFTLLVCCGSKGLGLVL